MFQLFSTIMAASLVGITISLEAPASFQVSAGFEYLGAADGKVLLRPIDGLRNQYLTYQDAIITCEEGGYRIATIETEAQHKILWPQQPEACTFYPSYWIDGVSFQDTNNFFSTKTGQNLTYTAWAQGRPVQDVVPDNRCLQLLTTCTTVPHRFDMTDSRCHWRTNTVACEASVV